MRPNGKDAVIKTLKKKNGPDFIIKNIKKNKEETLVQEYIPQEEIGESQARQTK